jgi:hypothetical protein
MSHNTTYDFKQNKVNQSIHKVHKESRIEWRWWRSKKKLCPKIREDEDEEDEGHKKKKKKKK